MALGLGKKDGLQFSPSRLVLEFQGEGIMSKLKQAKIKSEVMFPPHPHKSIKMWPMQDSVTPQD